MEPVAALRLSMGAKEIDRLTSGGATSLGRTDESYLRGGLLMPEKNYSVYSRLDKWWAERNLFFNGEATKKRISCRRIVREDEDAVSGCTGRNLIMWIKVEKR